MCDGAGGVTALMHACSGSPAELQTATLTVLRQLVVQPAGPDAFLLARAIPLLAMLQHSLVAEIRILATKILERISASSSNAEDAIADEHLVQVCCFTFLSAPSSSMLCSCPLAIITAFHLACSKVFASPHSPPCKLLLALESGLGSRHATSWLSVHLSICLTATMQCLGCMCMLHMPPYNTEFPAQWLAP